MTYNYRCKIKSCGLMQTLPRLLEQYTKRPHCRLCKGDTLVDRTKTERARTKTRTCKCDGIRWPHRIGTEPWCVHAKIGPTEEDFRERHNGGW